MTLDQMRALVKKCLAEYEPSLKVVGPLQAWGVPGTPKMVKETVRRPLDSIDEREMQFLLSMVLEKLGAEGKHGFTMSDPDPVLGSLYKVHTVGQGKLNLHYVGMYDGNTLETISHFVCWFHPV